jgi:putative ABC transport system permease protein
MHFPVLLLFSLAIVLILLSVLTAILSGREAMSIGPVRAVREDW